MAVDEKHGMRNMCAQSWEKSSSLYKKMDQSVTESVNEWMKCHFVEFHIHSFA